MLSFDTGRNLVPAKGAKRRITVNVSLETRACQCIFAGNVRRFELPAGEELAAITEIAGEIARLLKDRGGAKESAGAASP